MLRTRTAACVGIVGSTSSGGWAGTANGQFSSIRIFGSRLGYAYRSLLISPSGSDATVKLGGF
jgi:hypothetical protein